MGWSQPDYWAPFFPSNHRHHYLLRIYWFWVEKTPKWPLNFHFDSCSQYLDWRHLLQALLQFLSTALSSLARLVESVCHFLVAWQENWHCPLISCASSILAYLLGLDSIVFLLKLKTWQEPIAKEKDSHQHHFCQYCQTRLAGHH